MNVELRVYNRSRGFTLIELLIVIAIIGVLSALLMANFIGVRQRARDSQRKADLRQIQSALELYRSDLSSYPNTVTSGQALTSGGTTYMQKVPTDPLNSGQSIYSYRINGAGGCTAAYCLYACLENTSDAQKDPSNNSTYCTGGSTNWSFTVTNP